MTKTMQFSSRTSLRKTDKDFTIQKPEAEEIKTILHTIIDELKNLQKMYCTLIELTIEGNSLRIAESPYLQEIQRLTHLIKNKEEGEKNEN